MKFFQILIILLLVLPAHAQEAWIPPSDNPTNDPAAFQFGDWQQHAAPDPAWTLRTGAKKGVIDNSLDAEAFAGPDAAVLRNGFYHPWQSLLAEFTEPSSFVEPSQIAGLARTKPYLIIPSGALRDLSGSKFFKAALAEYAGAGGIIICFAQPKSADFTSLPVADETKSVFSGAGWSEDAGSLFRASSVQTNHPMLAGIAKTTPDIETSGYLSTYPADAVVALSRSDGYPSLIVYPYGAGQVIVTTMFSDFSYEQGQLNADEKNLVRSMLLWAKSGGRAVQAAPSTALTFTLSLRGPEQGEAASAKIRIIAMPGAGPLSEATVTTRVRSGQTVSLPYAYTVPAGMQPGIYHLEYILADAQQREMGAARETSSGWFSIGNPAAAQPLRRQPRPLSGFPAELRVTSSVTGSTGQYRLGISILPVSQNLASAKQSFFVRAAGQEKLFTLGTEGASVSIDLPATQAGIRIPFAVYHSSGRSIFRGSAPLPASPADRVSLDRNFYAIGSTVRATAAGPGNGELSLIAPGRTVKQMLTGNGSMEFTLPSDLPTGTYRLRWKFTTLEGQPGLGDLPISLEGYRVRVQQASVGLRAEKDGLAATALLRIHSTRSITARITLKLREQGGAAVPVLDQELTLREGAQDVPLAFFMKPGAAGMRELSYELSSRPPSGPGFPAGPLVIASGHTLFDVGEVAVLGVAAAEPVYYEPSGPVEVTAYIYGTGRTRVELFLDNKRAGKEKLDLNGLTRHTLSLPSPAAGTHSIKAVAYGDKLDSFAERSVVYGARFPDLAVSLKPVAPAGAVMQVGVGIRNQGKSASPQTSAALFEEGAGGGRSLISRIEVPPLAPGLSHVAIIEWPLARKAGSRILTAVVDENNAITESLKSNNTATAAANIPDLLLLARPQKTLFTSDEAIRLELHALNFTTSAYRNLSLNIALLDSKGKAVQQATAPIAELPAGGSTTASRDLGLAKLPPGTYHLNVQAVHKDAKEPAATASAMVTLLPTLLVGGSLGGTPPTASLCTPLAIHYTIANTGNIPVSTGSITLEVRSAKTRQPVFTRQLPLIEGAGTVELGSVQYPEGDYTVSLKASAVNAERNITREFQVAAQALKVSAPLSVTKSTGGVQRILVWRARGGTPVQRALAEKIVKEALDPDTVFTRVVDRADDFKNQAMSGIFTSAVIFEADELLDRQEWLNEKVARGFGLVLIGAEDYTRMIAEGLGFTFAAPSATRGAMLTFPEAGSIGLSGTMPVSGKSLAPLKKGAAAAALFAGGNQPAALLDQQGNGRVMALPFSLSRSALDTGTTSLYSLLLRSAVQAVAPGVEEPGSVSVSEAAVSAPAGQVHARVVLTLPAGSTVFWVNAGGAVKGTTVTYDLPVDAEQNRLLCLYQPPANSKAPAAMEAFYECNGKFISQGGINE